MEQTVSAVKLVAWPGWGAAGSITALAVLLAAILALLLPFPRRSWRRQLQTYQGRLDFRAHLGAASPLGAYRAGIRRLGDWLDEWFGPPFSAQAFERCLAIAFIYPVSLFLLTLVINGVAEGKVSALQLLFFVLAALAGAFLVVELLNWMIRFVQRLWGMIGGDDDLAPVLAKIALGGLAVATAFAIAFAIASVSSAQFYGAGPVAIATLAAFGLAFALAAAFVFAGLPVFIGAVTLLALMAILFASQFAFVLLLFFVAIPLINAGVDWLSWAGTRILLRKAERASGGASGLAKLFAILLATALIGAALAVILTILLANAFEAMNAVFSIAGSRAMEWTPLLQMAIAAPWTKALFITGMVLTPLAPVFLHLAVGAASVLARFTPKAREKAAAISEHPDVTMEAHELARVRGAALISRLWHGPAILMAAAGFALIGAGLYAAGYAPSRVLAALALCSTAWRHGQCPL